MKLTLSYLTLTITLLAGCQVGASVGANGSGLPAPGATAAPSSAPSAAPSTPANVPSAAPTDAPLPGGFVAQNPADAEMLAIMREGEKLLNAKYPSAKISLTALKSVSSQVVAGANYRMTADYTDVRGSGSLTFTVFRSLDGKYSLSADDYTSTLSAAGRSEAAS